MTRFIVVDIEAARGPTPRSGVMTEFAGVDLETGSHFYAKLYRTRPDEITPAIPVITDETPLQPLDEAMSRFAEWLGQWDEQVVFVSDNPGYDFMWIADAFDAAEIDNPFGHSSRRIGDLYAGLAGNWRDANKWKRWRRTDHDHTALNDAHGNAEALRTILEKFDQKLS